MLISPFEAVNDELSDVPSLNQIWDIGGQSKI